MSALKQFSDELSELVTSTSRAVVGVRQGRGQGSGFLIAPDGYVLTNSHVARGGVELRVRIRGIGEVKGELVGADPRTDLAVVRIAGGDFD
ncbi:MAG: trypsin-like peptidase domain-containing protein, partial [Candidatus Eisenbacteria bacterium]